MHSERPVTDDRCSIAFTIRRFRLRVISVGDMNRREMEAYAKCEEEAGA
jgi:uncharacterized DUF497 family protein